MSAFFGLTLLGSKSPFDIVRETPLHTFQARDFQDAFMQTYRPGFSVYSESDEEEQAAISELETATIQLAQLPIMLRYLYKCPKGVDNVPNSVRTLVMQAFGHAYGADDSLLITLPIFLSQMDELCRTSKSMDSSNLRSAYSKDGPPTREFVSNLEFRSKMVKHHRMEKDPREKALVPISDSMTLGWNSPTLTTKRMSTKSCEETRYASAMIKAGVYYY
ncbi:uncharacterized protein PHALS_07697 [Plasmopara halstedii]|uniref:Uncharacterized protein n=1 Tax=Plasmopara halstedii TaxID=4781 RepID=A0A0P1B851_PLAHL|nr:uncharacterized protein PHALS_07697 [Plasmopara halstedii]CEG49962.1 hypothetical protein PHALS_07697 [Plasmopara halstedii]|eukprot:XP_024586331.1 hypothetical protein PHALS_07697 [Plasmopara halstedii]